MKTISYTLATALFLAMVSNVNAQQSAQEESQGARALAPTAADQSNETSHLETVKQIRRRLMDDNGLSVAAKNVTVVTTPQGEVVLRGSVNAQREKMRVLEIAKSVAKGAVVTDHLEVRAQ